MPDARELLATIDQNGILDGAVSPAQSPASLDDAGLLSELGIGTGADDDITRLYQAIERGFREQRYCREKQQ